MFGSKTTIVASGCLLTISSTWYPSPNPPIIIRLDFSISFAILTASLTGSYFEWRYNLLYIAVGLPIFVGFISNKEFSFTL